MGYLRLYRFLLNGIKGKIAVLSLLAIISGIIGTHFLLAYTEEQRLDRMFITEDMQDTLMLIKFEQPTLGSHIHPYWSDMYEILSEYEIIDEIGRQASGIIEVSDDKQGLMYFTSQSILDRIDLSLSAGNIERWQEGETEIPVILDHRLCDYYEIGDVFSATVFPTVAPASVDSGVDFHFKVSGFLQRDNLYINLFVGYAKAPELSDWAMRVLYDYLPEDEVLQIPLFIAPYEPVIQKMGGFPYSEGITFALHLNTTNTQEIQQLQYSLMEKGIGIAYSVREIYASEGIFQNAKMLLYGIAFFGILLLSLIGIQYSFMQRQLDVMLIMRMLGMPKTDLYFLWNGIINAVLVVFTYIGGQLVPYVGSFETYYVYLELGALSAILPSIIVLITSLIVSIAVYRIWFDGNLLEMYRRERH